MAPVRIRAATPVDAEGITRVYLESAEHHAAIDPARYYVPGADTILERYRTGEQHPRNGRECITLVAEIDGRIAGFLDARIERPFDPMHRPMVYCYVAEIAVSAGRRSQGIGRQLMQAAEQWGREKGANVVSLEYNSKNPRAAAFYERIGYETATVIALKWLQK